MMRHEQLDQLSRRVEWAASQVSLLRLGQGRQREVKVKASWPTAVRSLIPVWPRAESLERWGPEILQTYLRHTCSLGLKGAINCFGAVTAEISAAYQGEDEDGHSLPSHSSN